MSTSIHILSASGELKKYSKELRSVTKVAVFKVKKLLPLKDIDIIFYNNPKKTIAEIGGLGGSTFDTHTIFISLNHLHPNFRRAIKHELLPLLAHELFHAVHVSQHQCGTTMLEAMISEGLADHFSMEVTGKKIASPWSYALTTNEKKKMLKKAKKEWHKLTYDHSKWFFGAHDKSVPRWTGYTLGYDLVEKYLRTKGLKASELVFASMSSFIELQNK